MERGVGGEPEAKRPKRGYWDSWERPAPGTTNHTPPHHRPEILVRRVQGVWAAHQVCAWSSKEMTTTHSVLTSHPTTNRCPPPPIVQQEILQHTVY